MENGYVSAGTDTGFEWAIGPPEKWADWGHRAVHEMTVVTKTLANAYYGKPIRYSYWNSCHNGGNQELNEAQRYPEEKELKIYSPAGLSLGIYFETTPYGVVQNLTRQPVVFFSIYKIKKAC